MTEIHPVDLDVIRHNHSAEYLNFQKLREEWEFEKKKQAKTKDPGRSHSMPGKK